MNGILLVEDTLSYQWVNPIVTQFRDLPSVKEADPCMSIASDSGKVVLYRMASEYFSIQK